MRRARVLGTLLVLILLICGGVIYLDQRGALGASSPGQTTATPATPSTSTPSDDPGYGELK
ncbi:hypothetical protein DAERI_130149 [Deinococcus aerius]|uniref:Uncharacterized protein n=1 Tax=Deinococcus aerius TaxID=200253 RepID=A0A2I9CYS6_9DEIO|nr:hypothetical protein [Deinococcus aerius]GBF07319.1 hypothetical protein DAERI_130149 [Deinococcus aerius]